MRSAGSQSATSPQVRTALVDQLDLRPAPFVMSVAEPGGELQAARPSADGVRLDWSAIGGLAAQDASDPFAVGQFAKAPGRAFRRSSASDATKMSRPATASTAPTHPVEAHPNPAPMATPPNHAPIALAMLKAE